MTMEFRSHESLTSQSGAAGVPVPLYMLPWAVSLHSWRVVMLDIFPRIHSIDGASIVQSKLFMVFVSS